ILSPAHEVRSFAAGEAALLAVRDEAFDVAIVDIRMPGMDGFELTRAIKAARPRTEVILVTGSVTDLDEKLVRSVKERAGFFITKPFSRAVVTSLVAPCLAIRPLEVARDGLSHMLAGDLARALRFQHPLVPMVVP